MKSSNSQDYPKLMHLVGKGREAEVFSFRPGWVLKVYYSKSQNHLATEERVQHMLVDLGLPVVPSDGIVVFAKRSGIVFQYFAGKSMLRELTIKPWRIVSLGKELAHLHSLIHSKRLEGIPNQNDRLKKKIERMKEIEDDTKRKAIRHLGKLEDMNRICHGDFHPDNILIGNKCSKVIDWSSISRGNPLSDVARTSLILRLGDTPPGMPFMVKSIIGLGRRVFHTVYLNYYFKLNPKFSRKELRDWLFPVAIDRLSEGIPAERKALLKIINTYC